MVAVAVSLVIHYLDQAISWHVLPIVGGYIYAHMSVDNVRNVYS